MSPPKTQVVTERTSKRIKLFQGIFGLVGVVAAAMLIAGFPLENGQLVAYGMIGLIVSVPILVTLRVIRWWNHA